MTYVASTLQYTIKSKQTRTRNRKECIASNIAITHHPALYTACVCSSIQMQLGNYATCDDKIFISTQE